MKTNWSSLSRNGSLALTRPGTLVQCNTAAPWVAGGGEKQIEGFCAPMTFCNHFFFTWFTNVYLIFPGFCPQGFSLPNLEQNLSVVAALNRSLTSASHLKKHLRKVNVISEICLKFSLNTLEYRYIKVCMQCG